MKSNPGIIAASLATGLIMAAGVCAQAVYSVNVVGFQKIDVPQSGQLIASTPFLDETSNINDALGPQLTGSTAEINADSLWMWDQQNQKYLRNWLFDSQGALPQYDGQWFAATGGVSTAAITPGLGFWLISRQPQVQQIVMVGDIITNDVVSVQITEGIQLFGNPFSAPFPLNGSTLAADGAQGATTEIDADSIWTWNPISKTYDRFWLFESGGLLPDLDGKWIDAQGNGDAYGRATINLEPGLGYWYVRRPAAPLNWNQTRPY